MKAVEIKPGIYWVGAKDWNVRDFHGYKTQSGTTYNAFLIIDDKITLIDTVKETHCNEMLTRIASVVDPSRIDTIICNHVELDHAGSLPHVLKIAKSARVIVSQKGEKGLKLHFNTEGWDLQPVASGEEMSLGHHQLKFIHTPMVHWPDSMVTYLPDQALLLPNDAFGQHLACDSIFADEAPADIVMREAAKYYANIVYPYGKRVLAVLEGLKIDMIAPSHGVIWRKDLSPILSKYAAWASGTNTNKALIIYDSMWGATEAMAGALRTGFEKLDIPVTMSSLKHNHISDVMTQVLESRYIAVGSPTLNNHPLPSVAGFASYLEGLGASHKIGFVFGSYGWYRDGLSSIVSTMQDLKWKMPCPTFNVNYRPTEQVLAELSAIAGALVDASS